MEINQDLINKIRSGTEKEKLLYELKRYGVFEESDFNEKIGKEIVAFANRFGGTIIFGITDDGETEKKLTPIELETFKEKIENLIKTKISPQVNYKIQLFPIESNEVLVIEIERHYSMPCSIVRRGGHEIISRQYHVRTEFGTKLVDDITLEWLFKNENINSISYEFVHNVIVDNKENKLLDKGVPRCIYQYDNFLRHFRETGINFSSLNYDFFSHLTPFVFLSHLSHILNSNTKWHVDYFFDSMIFKLSERKSEKDIKTDFITSREFLDSLNKSTLSYKGVDFEELLNKTIAFSIAVPEGTKINIHLGTSGISNSIHFTNTYFSFKIKFDFISCNHGIYSKHYLSKSDETSIDKRYFSIVYNCSFDAQFTFPDYENELYYEHLHFANTIKNFISSQWDARHFHDNEMPNELLRMVYRKMN